MAEERIVIERQFGVEREQPAIGGSNKRIDLDERSVSVEERLIKIGKKLHGGIDLLRIKPECKSHLARLKRFQTHARIDVLLQNGIGSLRSHLFDIHSAGGRCHEHGLASGAVHQNSQIQFLLDRQGFFNQQPPHDASFGTGLVRNQSHAQHLFGNVPGLVGRLGDLYPSALAASAGMNLRFDHYPGRPGAKQCFSRSVRFFARGGHRSPWHGHTVLLENSFSLVLVDFHNSFVS